MPGGSDADVCRRWQCPKGRVLHRRIGHIFAGRLLGTLELPLHLQAVMGQIDAAFRSRAGLRG